MASGNQEVNREYELWADSPGFKSQLSHLPAVCRLLNFLPSSLSSTKGENNNLRSSGLLGGLRKLVGVSGQLLRRR